MHAIYEFLYFINEVFFGREFSTRKEDDADGVNV